MNRKTIRYYRVLGIILGFSLILGGLNGGASEIAQAPSQEVAQTFLKQYIQDVINGKNFAAFGFDNYGETRLARVGQPYPVMLVPLNGLKEYQGTGLKSLWAFTGKWWFPVLVKGQGRTKLEVVERNGQYLAGEFGGTRTAREILGVIEGLQPSFPQDQMVWTDIRLVTIPALKANFLYVETNQMNYLIPCMALPGRYGLENGTFHNPEELLKELTKYAAEIDGNLIG